MKAGMLAIWPWLICQYNKNTLVDLPSSVILAKKYAPKTYDQMKKEADWSDISQKKNTEISDQHGNC